MSVAVFDSPFSFATISLLRRLSTPTCGVTSFRLISLPLVGHITRANGPVVVSAKVTGRSRVRRTVSTTEGGNYGRLVMLRYIDNCPTPTSRCGLGAVTSVSRHFSILSKLSSRAVSGTASMTTIMLNTYLVRGRMALSHGNNKTSSDFSLRPRRLTRLYGSSGAT